MKIIHIAGYSNSGKTVLIKKLVTILEEKYPGKTGVIKHLGHHNYDLNPGKDMTGHFENGAKVVTGIDGEKSVIYAEENDLNNILGHLSDAGIKYAVIEGFKKYNFRKVCLGDLEAENCIFKNPDVSEIVESLDKFDDFFTMQGLVRDLRENIELPKTGCIITFNGIVREITGENITKYLEFTDTDKLKRIIDGVTEDIKNREGILGVRIHHNSGRINAGDDITYIAVAASHREEGFAAVQDAVDRIKSELHDA
ncbi:molybdopterin-guanine dinucleotide biosynthesis protein B [Methanoplanus endosymbiosus]|uniref:Molybdopterin-guanine dinucleotide biosynthesis protein B n=1 Tax=Methanoplanus endosymbiosus TaxID=33865 RepID=A0A9E7PMG9_9EURY|nr:molybdopterin-guanine dinucleotide biosynthesis protein B [Methanoplanus endosymbiosus]UUX91601.1 molybdopterin-guanine dinucleotide biosynthesis protein B [Methanoplanus endosymbiosus]